MVYPIKWSVLQPLKEWLYELGFNDYLGIYVYDVCQIVKDASDSGDDVI